VYVKFITDWEMYEVLFFYEVDNIKADLKGTNVNGFDFIRVLPGGEVLRIS
jgi:hypothetical protein